MKKNIIILCLTFFCYATYGQDTIIFRDASEIKVKVVDADGSEIKYRKYENLNGPLYSVPRAEVFIIRYENGTKRIITGFDEARNTNNTSSAGSAPADSSKYEYIATAAKLSKKDLHSKKLYISPQILGGIALGGGSAGGTFSAEVLGEYFPNKNSSNGLCVGLGYDLRGYEGINVNNIDVLLGYTMRSSVQKLFARAMLNIGIPVSTTYSGMNLTEYTNPLVGLECDLGAHFKKFNIGGRLGYSVVKQFKSEDSDTDNPMRLCLFLGFSF